MEIYIYIDTKNLETFFLVVPNDDACFDTVTTQFLFKMCVNINIRLVTIIDAMNHETNCTLAF